VSQKGGGKKASKVMPQPILPIFFSSSFFWLFAIMLSAIIWYSIPGMERLFAASIFVSVTIQEYFLIGKKKKKKYQIYLKYISYIF
jgi:hypothetical protein